MVVMNRFEGNKGQNVNYKRDHKFFGIKTTFVIKLHKDMFFNFLIRITIIYLGYTMYTNTTLPSFFLCKEPLVLVLTLKILYFWVSS